MFPIKSKIMAISVATLIGSLVFGFPAHSQPPGDADSEFVNLGSIAFSNDYKVSENRSFVTFKIKNQESRTLSHIFGWVYLQDTGDGQTPPTFQLMNNPHQSGVLIEGGPHRPGSTAQWRFILKKTVPPDPNQTFTLRVSPKSLYYAVSEPPRPKQKDKKK